MSVSSHKDPVDVQKAQAGFKSPSEKRAPHLGKKTLSEGQREQPIHRRSVLAIARYCLPSVVHRPIIRSARRLKKIWSVNSGEWQWISEKPLPLKLLSRSLWKGADASLSYYIMLFLSGVIAVLGLLAGSTAAIIGAMIVAPLMGPIVAMAFAITMNNRRLLKQSLLSVLTGSLMVVLTAFVVTEILGITTLNPEIVERTQPTLIDLAVGLAAGAAGSFAKTRREIADALPGVAIAVALVPPLSVIGIGLALDSRSIALGSTLLFLTNLCGIILSGGLVFIWQDYGSVQRAKKGLTVSTVVVCLLAIPLGLSMRDLIIEEKTRSSINRLVRRETYTFRDTDVRTLKVDSRGGDLMVRLEVAAPEGSISEQQVNLVHAFLEDELERSLSLDVSIFPVQEYKIPEEEGDRRTLGRPAR